MITIIYPQNDYEAADIAIKAQALSQSSGKKVYVVPKHFGRSHEAVFANLKKSTIVLFFAFERTDVDSDTEEELEFLLKNNIKIYCIVPERMIFPFLDEDNVEVIEYPKKDRLKAISKIQEIINTLSPSGHKSNDESNTAALMGILLLVVIILTIAGQASTTKKAHR